MLPEMRKFVLLRTYERFLRARIRLRSDYVGGGAESNIRTSPQVLDIEGIVKPKYETPFVIFDSAKHSKCRLTTLRPTTLTWYSCGPTVYDSAHIGHAATFIRQDVIRRIMEHMNKEIQVIQVMGITDIDDKIIAKANETRSEWTSISKHYEREFMEDLKSLNVISPHMFTRVSDYVPQILKFVNELIHKGYAYPVDDGSVYFDTRKYGDRYGIFRQSSQGEDEAENVALKSHQSGKKSVRDFAVWKGAKVGEPYWNSPWGSSGKGRPGWHIECSVMASEIFGSNLDFHTGGKDLIFPHHENEEAQCCAHHQSSHWSSHWIHMGHLHFKGDVKMSKSLGNTLSIRNFLEMYSPDVLRVMCIVSRYRNDLEYSPDSVDNAQKVLKKFQTFLNDTASILNKSKLVVSSSDSGNLWGKLETAKMKMTAAFLDDFDTSEAVKAATEFISNFNRHFVNVDSQESVVGHITDFELVLASQMFVQNFCNVVGILASASLSSVECGDIRSNVEFQSMVSKFVKFRNDVRSFSLAVDETNKDSRKIKRQERMELLRACDSTRNQFLSEHNIEIKDHGNSSSWSFSENNVK